MNKTGEKPGKGSYQCTKCGKVITLEYVDDILPPCPDCHATSWRKLD
jgi:predicted  nucleic acid-binding Zn-ribbon protein